MSTNPENIQTPPVGNPPDLAAQLAAALAEIERLKSASPVAGQTQVVAAATEDEDLTPEIVERITPAQVDSSPGNYFLSYVTTDCQPKTVSCAAQIYSWAEQTQPWYDVHTNWILHKNKAGMILSVTRKPHLRQGPLGQRFSSGPDEIVLLKSGNQYEPAILPIKFSGNAILQEVLDAINGAGNIKPGNTVGRFIVRQLITDESSTTAVLALKAQ